MAQTHLRSSVNFSKLALLVAGLCYGWSGVAQANDVSNSVFNQNETPASLVEPGTAGSASSPDDVWRSGATLGAVAEPDATINVLAVNPREVVLDLIQLESVLGLAPVDVPGVAQAFRPKPVHVYLPSPDGGYVKFVIRRTQMLSLEMEAQYPGITTYSGFAVNDRSTSVVLDLTPSGFHAQVLQPGKRWFVDPQFRESTPRYVSYYKTNKKHDRVCLVDGGSATALPVTADSQNRSGDILRTYRLVVAATGEYGQFFGGVTPAVSAMVTTVNRVRGIYEKELAVSFLLPAVVVSDNPATDPFTGNNNASVLINESQTVLDSTVGSANYDIGHTFSTGAGGLAGLGVVCSTSSKGRGVTGSSNPTGDAYDVDYVAHEIGHQFGGRHTFNGANGSCSGNRSGGTAYEPGSGSTIQAYAGICGADNLQSNSDPIMHAVSHFEIMQHVTIGSGSLCGSAVASGNTVPTVDAKSDYNAPHSTPLILVGSGADADSDPVTFLWEQLDLGPQAALSAPDDGNIPLFRVLTPTPSSARFLPDFSSVDTNTPSTSEKMPALARSMRFGLTARDNVGGVEISDMDVLIDSGSGPFVVTSPNGGETISGMHLVTWDVAGTDLAPVSADTVHLFVNTAGSGLSYTALGSTPNDGSELIDFGAYPTPGAKLLISHTDTNSHTFYDISDGTFTINPPPPAAMCNGLTVTVDLNLGGVPTTGDDVILGTPSGEIIRGLGGDDTICGGDGYDIIYGGPGDDTLYGGDSEGNDTTFNTLYGGSGDDSIYGSAFDDWLYGQGGHDYLVTANGTALQDKMFGGSGNDVFLSFSDLGGSLIRGQGNNDTVYGSDYADVIMGDPGFDTLHGGGGNDSINGGSGRDTLYGDDGDDSLVGAGQRDSLYGGLGDDVILGGLGNDTLDGGGNTAVGDTCNGQGQEAIGAGDTAVNCEIVSGIPRLLKGLAVIQSYNQPGRKVLSDEQLDAIDRCDATLEQCLAKQ